MSFLEIRSVTKTYPGASAPCIQGLDLSVEEGEITVILGPSGCGKSTLLKMISGLELQDSGTIEIDGRDMGRTPPERRNVSMVFQKAYLFRNMSVAKNVNYAPRLKRTMKGWELQEETERMLNLVGLGGYGDRKATELSGGQEQRVSLARALMTRPKVLLLDEPFSALDAELRVSMRESLKEICKSLGQTVIFVTHDQQEAVAIADRIALMMDGRILQYGTPDVFYSRPVSERAAVFFGWKNVLPAVYHDGRVRCALGEFDIPDAAISDGEAVLMIHPRAFISGGDGGFEGTVRSAIRLGTVIRYKIECRGTVLEVEGGPRDMFYEGEYIKFDLDRRMIWPAVPEPAAEEGTQAPGKRGIRDMLRRRT